MGLTTKSVRELKSELDMRGVDYSQCREKAELQELLKLDGSSGPAAAECTKASMDLEPLEAMSIKQLKVGLEARGVDFSHCNEKQELIQLLRGALTKERNHLQNQRRTQDLARAGFAIHSASGARCWIEGIINETELLCHWDDGTLSKQACTSLDPVLDDAVPRPITFEGSFEEARAVAFHSGKILVAHVRYAQPCKANRLFELALYSDEVRSLLDGNAVFWSGCGNELKTSHAYMLTPGGSPSLAMVLPLATDAMRVLSSMPLADKDAFVNNFLNALESLHEHQAAAEARLISESALLRQEQDEEFLAALAVDQAADIEKQKNSDQADAVVVETQNEACEAMEEQQQSNALRHRLADRFKALPSPVGLTSRIMIRLPTGERVERTFSADTPLSCVYDWATCCNLLPEGCGRTFSLPRCFEFRLSFPQRRLGRDQGEMTLADLGLVPNAALLVVDAEV